MKINIVNGKLIFRFTLNFILHQILLFLTVSLPAVFYIVVLKQPMRPALINMTVGLIITVYFLYCLFYGYYIARPMYDVLIPLPISPAMQICFYRMIMNGAHSKRKSFCSLLRISLLIWRNSSMTLELPFGWISPSALR